MCRMALPPGTHFATLASLETPVDVPAVVANAVNCAVVADSMMNFVCFAYFGGN